MTYTDPLLRPLPPTPFPRPTTAHPLTTPYLTPEVHLRNVYEINLVDLLSVLSTEMSSVVVILGRYWPSGSCFMGVKKETRPGEEGEGWEGVAEGGGVEEKGDEGGKCWGRRGRRGKSVGKGEGGGGGWRKSVGEEGERWRRR